MAVLTPTYPATLDTLTTLGRVANFAITTVGAGGVDSSATTVPITSTTGWPSDGVCVIGSEAIAYTGTTGTSITGCTRGFDSTTPASHSAGDSAYGGAIVSAHYEALRDAIIAIETLLGANGVNVLPGGADGTVQYNNGGVLGGTYNLYFGDDPNNANLFIGDGSATGPTRVELNTSVTAQNEVRYSHGGTVYWSAGSYPAQGWSVDNEVNPIGLPAVIFDVVTSAATFGVSVETPRLGINTTPAYTLDVVGDESTPDAATNVAGYSAMYNIGGADPNATHGGIWPEDARMGFTVARKFSSGGGADGPTTALTAHVESNMATSSGVALMTTGRVMAANGVAFGANLIALGDNVAGAKLVGCEIDVMPFSGQTVNSATGGLFLNAFNVDMTNAPALFVNGFTTGRWGYGLLINGITQNGVGVTIQSGAPEMEWGIHLNNGTFGTSAAQFGAQNDKPALILNQGVSATTANILEVKDATSAHTFFSIAGGNAGNWGSKSKASTDHVATLDATTAGRNVGLILRDAGADKWTLFKDGGNGFQLYGAAAGAAAISVATNNVATFTQDPLIPDEAYGSGWNAVLEPPTKNAVYDQIQKVAYEEIWDFTTTADGSNLGTSITDLFGTNTAITTLASTKYEFEILLWYARTTAGTATFTFTNTQTYDYLNAQLWHSPAAGSATMATSLNVAAIEGITTAAAALPATTSQTVNTAQHALIKGTFATVNAGTWRIRVTNSAGSFIVQKGSKFTVRRLPSGNIGSFVP